jgi:hypothetical protein
VLAILENLHITVATVVRSELERHDRTLLQTVMGEVIQTMAAERQDRRAYAQATSKFRALATDVARQAGVLSKEDAYGFVNFEAVGQGMIAEMWMRRRIGEDPAFRVEAAKVYFEYFDRVMSPTMQGSVGQRLSEARAQLVRADSTLRIADSYVSSSPVVVVEKRKYIKQLTCEFVYGDLQRTFTGSSSKGFKAFDQYVRMYAIPYCTGPNHPTLEGVGGSDYAVESTKRVETVVAWNNAIEQRVSATRNIKLLEQLLAIAQTYRDYATEYAVSH